ncbi:MAG: hypothetical protein LHW45_10460 [Candidatus Cloacimonetes bacterium]|nr:hypothetical protein [Candidatus Cloacimonadota bacterium]MDY0368032.1 hypothetical protein [Candidatus Syntrophosphaera sp.]
MVFPGILNKNGVFGEENPCHHSGNIARNWTKLHAGPYQLTGAWPWSIERRMTGMGFVAQDFFITISGCYAKKILDSGT